MSMNSSAANPRSQVGLGNGESSRRNSIESLLHAVLRSLDEQVTPQLVMSGIAADQFGHPVAESRAEYDFRFLHDSKL
jgi:hypothetical protein